MEIDLCNIGSVPDNGLKHDAVGTFNLEMEFKITITGSQQPQKLETGNVIVSGGVANGEQI